MLFGKFTTGDRMLDDLADGIITIAVLWIVIFLGSPFYNTFLKGFF